MPGVGPKHDYCNDGFAAVYILDFSYPREITGRIAEACNLVLIDHHKTAAENLEGIGCCHFDTARSGAVLAWQHFHPGAPIPEILLYVEDRDLWLWQLPHSREINAALGELKKDFAVWDRASENLDELRFAGEALLRTQQARAEALARAAHPATVNGRSTLAAPCDELRSETANAILEQNPELRLRRRLSPDPPERAPHPAGQPAVEAPLRRLRGRPGVRRRRTPPGLRVHPQLRVPRRGAGPRWNRNRRQGRPRPASSSRRTRTAATPHHGGRRI